MYEGKIFQAIQFISYKHKNQTRLCFEYPYVTHPLMVFHMVSQYSDDEDVHLAALLHDTVEDTDTSLEEIENTFGTKVRNYVSFLSEDKSLEIKKRKKQYRDGFVEAPKEVLLIKAADLLYNLIDITSIIEDYPDDDFSKRVHSEHWLVGKKKLIETIRNEWTDNPFLPRLTMSYKLLSEKVIQNNFKKV